MRRILAFLLLFAAVSHSQGAGLLVPKEKEVPPLAMLNHQVTISIDDQVAITRVEQTFRNHTSRELEATYIFPVPKGASVQKFSMWVDGKKMDGELIEAKKAREIYTSFVRRTQDPGLLEYMGHKLLRMRVFPIKANSDQKVSFQYISTAVSDNGLLNYTYPLKADGKAIRTLEDFAINVSLKSQHAVQNIYSPTHAITITRKGDKEANVTFTKAEALLDRNFELFYTSGNKDVGLTALTHRPAAKQKGHFMLLISPRAELSKDQQAPRDIVFVLDTSGSMRGKRIDQARKALNYCLGNLSGKDRFAVIHFATTVNKYSQNWQEAHTDNLAQAKKWVNRLSATGGTNINHALTEALKMRAKDSGRTFVIVFFTDGRPTVGITNTNQILKKVQNQNSKETRIFTFGVGNDVNATMLDQIAEQSRAVSTFVREEENIEDKVSRLYNKVSHPVLTNLEFNVNGVELSEVYPPELPDLFHGTQLVVLGRYDGNGHAAVKLNGKVGKISKEFTYEVNFAEKTNDEKPFVEDLWARRKVGYLLDQIRRNGEEKELVNEIITLAKRYGITTPYTSYLIVPDAPSAVTARRSTGGKVGEKAGGRKNGKPNVAFNLNHGFGLPPGGTPAALRPGNNFGGGGFQGGGFKPQGGFAGGSKGSGFPGGAKGGRGFGPTLPGIGTPANKRPVPKIAITNPNDKTARPDSSGIDPNKTKRLPTAQPTAAKPVTVSAFIKQVQQKAGDASKTRGEIAKQQLQYLDKKVWGHLPAESARRIRDAQRQWNAYHKWNSALKNGQQSTVQNGKVAVELSINNNVLRNQSQISNSAVRRVQNRNVLEVGGVWIDEGYHAKLKTVTVKALSKAYFRILERHPEVKDVFRLGNHLVWVTPSGTALIIDTSAGSEEMTDQAIDALFTVKK